MLRKNMMVLDRVQNRFPRMVPRKTVIFVKLDWRKWEQKKIEEILLRYT